MSDKLVQVEHLQQYFPAGGFGKNKKYVQAVDDVSFYIYKGETLGLVGESGCGKTTTGRTLLRLYEPTGGRFEYDGQVIFDVEKKQFADMLPYRKKMQIVFQDPYASLDPRMTIGDIVGEAIDVHKMAADKKERYDIIIEMLRRVGLNSEHANRYPHEFSGGQRQRLTIARALVGEPEILILDDSASALDFATDAKLRRAIAAQTQGMTVFIVSQRAASIKDADQILVLDDGRQVGLGTHRELLETCGVYHEICMSQFSEKELEKS